jgi:chloramphenicol-sensitive protein RarD
VAGQGAFWNAGVGTSLLLAVAGVFTAFPLLLFARAANSIPLQRLGFIQYLSPTCQLLLGVFLFKERPSSALLLVFVGVILAAAIYVLSRKTASVAAGKDGAPSKPQ